jgi:hypothetical protein
MTRIVALAALLALPALARSEVRNQGMVKSHLWTSTAGIESAQTSLRALTALANDATAWDKTHAHDLVKQAMSELEFARTHERHLKEFSANQDVAKDLARLDSDLDGARTLLKKVEQPIARGVGPSNDDTQADNTMLGGAAADRGLPPGQGGDVTHNSGRGQRGGTKAIQQLRNDIKTAWSRLDDARKDLDKLAGDYDTTTKLPEP